MISKTQTTGGIVKMTANNNPLCPKHNIPMKTVKPYYVTVDVTAGFKPVTIYKCPKRFCGYEIWDYGTIEVTH